MKLRRALLKRLRRVDDGGKLLPVDGDGVGGVARLAARARHDDRRRLADIAHRVLGERRIGAHLHRGAVLRGDRPAADQVADAVGGKLRAGQHLDDAGHLGGGGGVDLADLGVRMRRADEGRVAHAGHAHVVGIAAAAGDEALVFLAGNACANSFNAHRLPPLILLQCSLPSALAVRTIRCLRRLLLRRPSSPRRRRGWP